MLIYMFLYKGGSFSHNHVVQNSVCIIPYMRDNNVLFYNWLSL